MTYDSSYQEIRETECSRNCTVILLSFAALEKLEANFNLTETMVWPCILVVCIGEFNLCYAGSFHRYWGIVSSFLYCGLIFAIFHKSHKIGISRCSHKIHIVMLFDIGYHLNAIVLNTG